MRKTIRVLLAACLLATPALAGMSGGATDPYALPATGANADTNPVTLRAAQTLDAGVRNLVIIAPGQSNIANVSPSAYTPANPSKIDNFNVANGATYSAADPLLGSTSIDPGNPLLRIADTLITNNKFDRVVIVPLAVGGTAVADWQSGLTSTRISVALGRLATRGMVAGSNITVVVLWGQGEQDNALGTTQVAYTNSLNAVIAASRTAGFAGKWFVAKETYAGGTVSVPVQTAQAAVVNHGSSVWAGPDADALAGNSCSGLACRQADNTHWANAGSASYAAAWITALAASGAPF